MKQFLLLCLLVLPLVNVEDLGKVVPVPQPEPTTEVPPLDSARGTTVTAPIRPNHGTFARRLPNGDLKIDCGKP